eukprot:4902633-Pyramimonas_sp.AAC.1
MWPRPDDTRPCVRSVVRGRPRDCRSVQGGLTLRSLAPGNPAPAVTTVRWPKLAVAGSPGGVRSWEEEAVVGARTEEPPTPVWGPLPRGGEGNI